MAPDFSPPGPSHGQEVWAPPRSPVTGSRALSLSHHTAQPHSHKWPLLSSGIIMGNSLGKVHIILQPEELGHLGGQGTGEIPDPSSSKIHLPAFLWGPRPGTNKMPFAAQGKASCRSYQQHCHSTKAFSHIRLLPLTPRPNMPTLALLPGLQPHSSPFYTLNTPVCGSLPHLLPCKTA